MNRIVLYIKLIIKELLYPFNYLTAFFVGFVINYSMYRNPFDHLSPFIVPILVQALSKASVHFKNLDIDALLLLPQERVDPAFLSDKDGNVIISTGITQKLFRKNNIQTIHDFLDTDETILNIFEAFSPITKKWYQVEQKSVGSNVLVWLTNKSVEVELRRRAETLSKFSNSVLNNIEDLVYKNDVYDRLAKIILNEGFMGLFFTRLGGQNKELKGFAFKSLNGKIEKSSKIVVPLNSGAPVTQSRLNKDVIVDSVDNYGSYEEFEEANTFNSDVKSFFGFKVQNYINYHKEDVSVIAFNKLGSVSELDKKTIRSIVDNVRIIDKLMHLAKENDLRFLESIEGLCAAAEFSDEITGKHIYRVNKYSELIARKLGLDEKRIIWIGQVAAIHDIGKVAMPEVIKIDKAYTQEERKKMQMHTIIGANIIKKMMVRSGKPDKRLILAREIALLHHQEWCGKGYPGLIQEDGSYFDDYIDDINFYNKLRPLEKDEIPVEALIVSLADRYDALRSPRHYKPGLSHEETCKILDKDDRSGRTGVEVFGPTVYNVFLEIESQMEDIYESMKD